MNIFKKKEIYLDHAGSTPLDRKIALKMHLLNKRNFHNPSSIYSAGVKTRNLIEDARGNVANIIMAHKDEIIFTGSGTESDALAILGVFNFFRENNQKIIPHIITSSIEHPAVLENIKFLEKNNLIEASYIQPEINGIVDPKRIKESLKENTILVSVMYANNEIGTIQPVREISKSIRHFKKTKGRKDGDYPLFHTDACQAINYLYISNIEKLGVDLMSFNGSKIYGPKGVGVLYKKRNVKISPLYFGGGQEFELRSGTENASLIVGLSLALKKAERKKNEESKRLISIRNYAIENILELSKIYSPKIRLNGDRKERLPNNINISIFGISGEVLVLELSAMGICVSEKSDCKSKKHESSYVINSIYNNETMKNNEFGSIRISLGRKTRKKDIKYLTKSLGKILNKYEPWLN